MPTVVIIGPYQIFFYSADPTEPIHFHVERERNVAKFWLDPVRLERSGGFSARELGRIEEILRENRSGLIDAWHAYFST